MLVTCPVCHGELVIMNNVLHQEDDGSQEREGFCDNCEDTEFVVRLDSQGVVLEVETL